MKHISLISIFEPRFLFILNNIRRKIWIWLFIPFKKNIGSFFLDPRDHIGVERIITGDIYEGKTLDILERVITQLNLGAGLALDIGANIGNHTCWLAKFFRSVHSFEPGKVASLILRANAILSGYNNISIHQCALGNRKSGGRLNKVSETNLGSSSVTEAAEDVEFTIYRGDDYWGDLKIADRIELIKIDVEGFEYEVIKGFSEILKSHLPVLCVEVLAEDIWSNLGEHLVSLGYTSFYVVTHGVNGRGIVGKIADLILGRKHCLTPISKIFPIGGYDMIICLSRAHEEKFRAN